MSRPHRPQRSRPCSQAVPSRAAPPPRRPAAGSWRPAWRCWHRRFPWRCSRDVAGDHHGPLVAGQPPLPGDHGPAGVQVLFGLAAAVGEYPGIAGMDQDVVHGRVVGLRPCDLPGADVAPGQPQAVGAEADTTCRAEPSSSNRRNTHVIASRTASSGEMITWSRRRSPARRAAPAAARRERPWRAVPRSAVTAEGAVQLRT